MATVRKSITFTHQQDLWIKQQIEKGDYTNDSEYLRDLVRRDQADKQKLEELRSALQAGLDSGMGNKSVEEIWKEAEEQHAKKNT
ncbi:type II toxin-antitoxin system ParD family antitoxin [Flagellimonas myxillae]|uniref:type II toxin-antitoxin system ParD family antitoxin n=1 Tax=Flagellimonas myxillae TaxID=2942214 RepID=UPI00201EB30A|nr:type II toxin-antitoxin system ParD family antitoxin [Muricauda myxillae]MCL6267656.1 type II toxin-antitoxin system ParD family antitoxin [Muricauda myxillae]